MLFMVNVILSHSGGGTSFDGPWYVQLYDSVVNGFATIIEFFQKIVSDLELVLDFVGYALLHIPSWLGFLPEEIQSVLILGLVLVSVYMFLDRK